jgi:hypothetical protein
MTTEAEINEAFDEAQKMPLHYLWGIGGEIRLNTVKGWQDFTYPSICGSRDMVWRLEPREGVTDAKVFEVIDDHVAGTHTLLVHTDDDIHITDDKLT